MSSTALALLASGQCALVTLVHFAFPSGAVALNTSNWALTYGGTTYLGAYGIGSISNPVDKPGEVQGMTFELSCTDPTRLALALDASDQVQGTVVTVRTALLDLSSSTSVAIVDAPIEWTGRCDTMTLSEDGKSAVVSVTVESTAVDLLTGTPSTYSDADQQALYPGDRAFEFIVSQVDQPVVWPSREFFYR